MEGRRGTSCKQRHSYSIDIVVAVSSTKSYLESASTGRIIPVFSGRSCALTFRSHPDGLSCVPGLLCSPPQGFQALASRLHPQASVTDTYMYTYSLFSLRQVLMRRMRPRRVTLNSPGRKGESPRSRYGQRTYAQCDRTFPS